ncbi:translocation/assembly module TamB domain-containing protein, partial [Vibrio antiquarius]
QIEKVQGSLFPRFELQNVSFVDESLNIDAKVDRLALAVNFRCFFDPKVCVDELTLQGVNFQMPELPPAGEEPEETPPLRTVSTPVPIFVNKVSFDDINLNILGNQIDWQDFSTGLSMQGDRLVIAPTALKDINVALAPIEAEPEAATDEPKDAHAPPQDIVLPEVWIPLTVEARRLDIHNFKLAGEKPVIVHHLGVVAKAGGDRVDVKTLELDMP